MKKITLFTAAIWLLMASCATTKTVQHVPFDLNATSWQIMQLNGQTVQTEGDNFRLTFQDAEKINAKGSCNPIMGTYTQTAAGTLRLEPTATTRMLCPDMGLEADFLDMMESATAYSVVDNVLLIFEGEGVIARFKRL